MSSRLRLVFHITKNNITGRDTYKKNGADVSVKLRRSVYDHIAENVIVRVAEGQRQRVARLVNAQFRKDVDAEINHAAAQYGRYALGSSRVAGPQSGTQTSLFNPQAESESTFGRMGGWKPRRDDYLKRKRREYGHVKWFIQTGYMRHRLRQKGAWQDIWGGTRVSVILKKTNSDSGAEAFATAGRGTFHTHLASIKVAALPKLSRQFNNVRQTVGAYDSELAHRVLGRRGNYRPTLEPFLIFVVNRAIPAGIQARLEAGLRGSIYRKR